jgi:hypothetical protein
MKVSNFADVGQMRRSSGISMKMMRNELALDVLLVRNLGEEMGRGDIGRKGIQAERAEQNHDADVEEMRDSEGETEEYAYDSSPAVEPNISHISPNLTPPS